MDYSKKYLKYKAKYLRLKSILDKKEKNIMNGGASSSKESDKTIYLFKADWCPHCNMFKPVWDKLKNDLSNKLKFITYDSDKNSKEIKEYKIDGFPTIILKIGSKAIEYVGPRDETSLKEFINQYN